jgi:hypothetical protein
MIVALIPNNSMAVFETPFICRIALKTTPAKISLEMANK